MLVVLGRPFPPKCFLGKCSTSFRYSTLQSTQHKIDTQHNTQPHNHTKHTTTTKISRATLPQAAFLSLHGQGTSVTPKSSRHHSPTSVRRSQATELALAGVSSLCFDVKFHIKNREREGGALALGGCRLAKKPNNQLIVGGYNREGIKKETRLWRNMQGDAVASFWLSN